MLRVYIFQPIYSLSNLEILVLLTGYERRCKLHFINLIY